MYSFLSHLSFVDTCFSSVVGPKVLADFFAERKAISFLGCALQQWFSGFFVAIECLLLASMAYDRYVAICNPLLYSVAMSQMLCIQLGRTLHCGVSEHHDSHNSCFSTSLLSLQRNQSFLL
ncbi:hypothetical protein CB1_001371005 [Camelus ferus]|nr:hypothetical protein CB1_001371005 [Camelus ferus]